MSAQPKSLAESPSAEQPSHHGLVFGSVAASVLWVGSRRLEGEAYLMGGYGIRVQLEALPNVKRVSQLARVWQPGRLKGVLAAPNKGVPFISTNQTFDIRPVVRKWLSPSHVDDLPNRYLKPGTILITCSGNGVANNVGKVFASYSAHDGIVISHDLLRLDAADGGHFGWLYAFLRGRFGRSMLRSNQYGSAIKHLEPEHVEAIPVPLVSDDRIAYFDTTARAVFKLRDDAFRLLVEADALFAKRIAVQPDTNAAPWFDVDSQSVFARSRRLDGYHYNQRARAVLEALRQSGHPLVPLSELVDGVLLPNRFTRVYRENGTPFLDSEDIFKVNPDITKFIPLAAKKDSDAYKVKSGWLLMARSGQIYGINGSVALATKWHEGKLIAEHVIRIRTKTGKDVPGPGYLATALGHATYGRPLVLRWAFGSGVPELSPHDVGTVPIVRLGRAIEAKISEMVENAGELRRQADEMEDKMVSYAEALVEAVLRGDPLDEQEDAALATVRLSELEAHPDQLVSGDALEQRLKALLD